MDLFDYDSVMTPAELNATTKGESCKQRKSSRQPEEKTYKLKIKRDSHECCKKKEECECCPTPVYPVKPCPNMLPLYSAYNTITNGEPQVVYNGGTAIEFPNDGDMTGTGITRVGPGVFRVTSAGIYNMYFQIGVSNPSQVVIRLNNAELPHTVTGTGNGNTQLIGQYYVRVNTPNSIIGVYNPINNSAIGIAASLGGAQSSNINLLIQQLSTC